MNTMIYTPGYDDPSYEDLVTEGIVDNHTGEVHVILEEYALSATTVYDVTHSFSGRGLYRGWVSNLQKAIRRGNIRHALRSAYEIGMMRGQFLTHLVNRFCKLVRNEAKTSISLRAHQNLGMLVYYLKHCERTSRAIPTLTTILISDIEDLDHHRVVEED